MPNPAPIDITNMPDLVKLAEEVEATKTPRELRRDNKTVAVIMPATGAKTAKQQKANPKAAYDAFLSAAGSLKGLIDAEELKKDITESRKLLTRPAIKL